MKQLSLDNPFYEFSEISGKINLNGYKNKITTFYVVEGSIEIELQSEKINLKSGEGLLVSWKCTIKSIFIEPESLAFHVISNKKKEDLIEIIDLGDAVKEEKVNLYKRLADHKKVVKPWGFELWIVWLKDYHVLKKINMKKGFKCSLQFHEKKYETNFLLSGKAKILKNFHVDKNSTDLEAKEIIKDVDLIKDYSKDVDAPYYFTNIPGEVHRVFSLENYTAYEVSTPELDDVIRIQDDSDRKSGKIISEHKK
jgi:hypothetical protein